MMCCSDCEGTFPLTIDECNLIQNLCYERISEFESDIKNADSHIYINLKMIESKIDGFIKLMESKGKDVKILDGTDFEEVTI